MQVLRFDALMRLYWRRRYIILCTATTSRNPYLHTVSWFSFSHCFSLSLPLVKEVSRRLSLTPHS